MKILVFAGATEGRELMERLAGFRGVEAVVSVATEYGRETLRGLPERFRVASGRLRAADMAEMAIREGARLVVDATHPYAVQASANIAEAARSASLPLLRLARAASRSGNCRRAASVREAAALLADAEGNVLLTTGSKELAAFAAAPGFAERFFVRVLPAAESIRECERLGIPGSRVIAMQGPFSRELNAALMRQFHIRVLVTKDGGAAGGFSEKIEAAEETGVEVIVIGRPPDAGGMDLDGVVGEILGRLEAGA